MRYGQGCLLVLAVLFAGCVTGSIPFEEFHNAIEAAARGGAEGGGDSTQVEVTIDGDDDGSAEILVETEDEDGSSSSVSVDLNPDDDTENDDQTPPPPTVDLKINGGNGPLVLIAPVDLRLVWSAEDAFSVTAWGDWSGAKATTGEELIEDLGVGNYIFAMTAIGEGGSASDSVLVTVESEEPPPPPGPLTIKFTKPPTDGSDNAFRVDEEVLFEVLVEGGEGARLVDWFFADEGALRDQPVGEDGQAEASQSFALVGRRTIYARAKDETDEQTDWVQVNVVIY